MSSKIVKIEGIGFVTLVKKRGNTNIRLSFDRKGAVRVSQPYWLPYQAGIEFAKQRKIWIETHRPERSSVLSHNDRIGKAHRIQFTANKLIQRPSVRTAHSVIAVSYPQTVATDNEIVQLAAHRGALRALKKEADALLPKRLETLAQKYDFIYSSVDTKALHSRWGSCSQHKNIVLNIYLMQLPWHLIDYVLVHELVHTQYLDHSSEFWACFESKIPSAKTLRKELKHYQTNIVATN